jgi:ABC-type Fe3+-hydroxamate transport system substrate-binding protein
MLFIDQLGNQITLKTVPKRMISLVPSQTEFLYELGLQSEIVGITKFCIHPKSFFKTTTKVGGTKQFNFELIDSLKPDLIIANKEENYQEGIEKLQQNYQVWLSDIENLQDSYKMMYEIGKMTDKEQKAKEIIAEIQIEFAKLANNYVIDVETNFVTKKVLYLIWQLQKICPTSKVILVDGELFSWYGSRLKHSALYFQDLFSKFIASNLK